MATKLSALEADMLAHACARTPGLPASQHPKLVARTLKASEKAACNRLVKKGLMTNLMDTFYEANEAGRERAKSIY